MFPSASRRILYVSSFPLTTVRTCFSSTQMGCERLSLGGVYDFGYDVSELCRLELRLDCLDASSGGEG